MTGWQELIRKMSSLGRLPESRKVAQDTISAMTLQMKREALLHFVTEQVEANMRAHTRSLEVRSQIQAARDEADRIRQKLGEVHGRDFQTLSEANAYDDQARKQALMDKRREAEDRRREVSDAMVRALRIKWSRELLDSEFKLGDGTSSTWGSATVEQHEARIKMLMSNTLGNIEAMRRHEEAVEILVGLGADCLDKVPAPPVDTSPSTL